MDRRIFLSSAVASLLPDMGLDEHRTPPCRLFDKFDYMEGRWVPIKPQDIRTGDVVWVRDDPPSESLPGEGEVVHVSRHDQEKQELWLDWRIDNATNQWVGP